MKRHEFILTIPPMVSFSHLCRLIQLCLDFHEVPIVAFKGKSHRPEFLLELTKEVGNFALQLVGALMLYDLVVATRDGRLKEEWEAWQKSGRHSEMRGIRANLSAYKYRGGFTKSFRQLFCHYSLWPDGLWKEYTGACMPLSVVHFISQCQEEDLSVLFHNMVLCVHTMQLGNCGCD
jgi:hypothetical protein